MRLIFTVILLIPSLVFAQRFTISGYVRDKATGESLIGAAVLNKKTTQGTTANVHGFYSITLPRDSVNLVYSYVGYSPIQLRFVLKRDTAIDVSLVSANQLDEVVVNATKVDEIQETTQMSSVNIPIETVKALPALLGQVDLLKIIQLMPGVKSSEGSTGLYVRGGGPDQNLMLLDGVPVYNASHLFGFFSVFNADAINRVELIKGGFPARYGGRLSSVIDINMKEGNMKKLHGEGSIDIIAGKFTLEGPIKKDRTSFLVSGRRTYIDALITPWVQKKRVEGRPGYFFYDFNTKLNHIINRNNRIYLSMYTGSDKAYTIYEKTTNQGNDVLDKANSSLQWGNTIAAFRWNSVLGPKLFSNLTTTYSRYNFHIASNQSRTVFFPDTTRFQEFHSEYISGIRDWSAKLDFEYTPAPSHYIRFGTSAINHRFSPGAFTYNAENKPDTTLGATTIDAWEMSAYAEDDIRIGDKLKVNAGVHASAFSVQGRNYHSVQPRLSARYLVNPELSIKASYATMMQFIHLLTNAGLGLPTDLWVPSTSAIKPQQAYQVALGIARLYKTDYEISVESYYKRMTNLIEYKEGASFLEVRDTWDKKVATGGRGESYGAEVFVQKKTGKFTGWIGYTLSWTNRQFDEINNGKWYPYKYDRRHDVSVAFTHEWSKRMDFSAAWVYGTGNAITLPVTQYMQDVEGSSTSEYMRAIYNYGDRNSFRMRSYHRLDVAFSFWTDRKWGRSKWSVGAYNVYSRKNPFYIDLITQGNSRKFAQYSLFPIIPSVSWSFKF
ncbi:MAG TPA: TonB-dependent receptor [Cyclobacteriaceae bacterium]|nr:TonB-dependent receptor [Cyclobacteriaceae bacterium]